MLPDIKPDKKTVAQRLDEVPDFNTKCFELFRQWSSMAKFYLKEWEPDIGNEQEIVDEIKKNFLKGVKETYNDAESREMPGFAIGHLAGFIQGTLTIGWSIRYLPKNEYYRQVLWLKSIRLGLSFRSEATEQINHLFTAYTQSNTLLEPKGEEIGEEDLAFYKVLSDMNFEENHREMLAFLDKLESKFIQKFIDNSPRIEVKNLSGIFGVENLEYILTGNKI